MVCTIYTCLPMHNKYENIYPSPKNIILSCIIKVNLRKNPMQYFIVPFYLPLISILSY